MQLNHAVATIGLKWAERSGDAENIAKAQAHVDVVKDRVEELNAREQAKKVKQQERASAAVKKMELKRFEIELEEAKASRNLSAIQKAQDKLDRAKGGSSRSRVEKLDTPKEDDRAQESLVTDERLQNAAAGALFGTAVAGPVGAAVGGIAGAVVDYHIWQTKEDIRAQQGGRSSV